MKVLRNQLEDRSADHLLRGVAEDPCRSIVPALDRAVQVFAQNHVVRGCDGRCEFTKTFRIFSRPLFALLKLFGSGYFTSNILAYYKYTQHVPASPEDRTIAVGPPDILQPPISDDWNDGVFVKYRLSIVHDPFEVRADDLPGVPPALLGCLSQACGMSLGEKRDKSIVIELYQLLTPEN